MGKEPDEKEIEVTPEMIAAGLESYYCYDREDYVPWEAVESIYRSMERARIALASEVW
jgi:hypothetical protein